MFYKAILNKHEIEIDSEKELEAILTEINQGKKLIISKHAIINPSYLQSIIPDWERETEKEKISKLPDGKKRNITTPSSEFAFLLAPSMKMVK